VRQQAVVAKKKTNKQSNKQTNKQTNKQKQKTNTAIAVTLASRVAGLAFSMQGAVLIARLLKLTATFALVGGGTRGKLAAWDQRQDEIMTWFQVWW
jgi:hypothetical protein